MSCRCFYEKTPSLASGARLPTLAICGILSGMEQAQKRWKIAAWIVLPVAAGAILLQSANVLFWGLFNLRALLICVLSVSIPTVLGTFFLVKSLTGREQKKKAVGTVLLVLFSFYIVALIGTLFLSRINFHSLREDRLVYLAHFEEMTNFMPFETVLRYIRAFRRGIIVETSLLNLGGNLILMMPMAFFLPSLFCQMRKFWKFLLLMLALLLSIEALQLLLCCGSCDVDDVILNLLGTLVAYGVWHIPWVKRVHTRLYIL